RLSSTFRRFLFFQSVLLKLKDWPRLRKSRNGAGEMFWEADRSGELILPGAQGLVFIALRSRGCGAAYQILASRSMLNADNKREGASRRGRSGTLGFRSGHRERFSAPQVMLLFV